MKTYIKNNKKGLLLVLFGFILLGFMIAINISNKDKSLLVNKVKYESLIKINESDTSKELTNRQIISKILLENDQVITFLTDIFKIEKEVFKNKLLEDYEKINFLDSDNAIKSIINYLFELEKRDKKLFNNKTIACSDSKEYMIALIKYFTGIYPEVDFEIAAGIAEVESGYTSKYMLNKNNIFGGMYKGNLIKYKNIEYGILKYIKLLNDGYFNKGLNTVETIGRVYNPTYDKNGKKVAKESWVKNVTNAMNNYSDYDDVDINTLINLKNQ